MYSELRWKTTHDYNIALETIKKAVYSGTPPIITYLYFSKFYLSDSSRKIPLPTPEELKNDPVGAGCDVIIGYDEEYLELLVCDETNQSLYMPLEYLSSTWKSSSGEEIPFVKIEVFIKNE
jgi:hypothetical protein